MRQFLRECDICQRYKSDLAASPRFLNPFQIPATTWYCVNMDFVDGLPGSGGKLWIDSPNMHISLV